MLTAELYLKVVEKRIAFNGGRADTVRLGPLAALTGNFLEPIMNDSDPVRATMMSLSVVAAEYPDIDAGTLGKFTVLAAEHAEALARSQGKVAMIVVIAGLVGTRVRPDAAAAASAKTAAKSRREVRMVGVDLTAGVTHAWVGRKFWGAGGQDRVNAKLQACFPAPWEAAGELRRFASLGLPGEFGAGERPYGGPAGAPPASQPYRAQPPGQPCSPAAQPQFPPGPGGFPGQQFPPAPPFAAQPGPPPAAGPAGPQPPHYPPPGRPPYGQ
ncbi:hypothetical protein [Amycolatopsis benzoatilytica]|uniref:hypothetical protein n=1 Tax=Amycolatopsis benzoatilytica TaxID=346045 RepID=UPI00036F755D|nr:hypothetical protein [Amycolatopsis benzoatilytica]